VFEAAEALSYKKGQSRKMAGAKIAILSWYNEKEELDDLYYMSIRIGVENECQTNGMQCIKYTYNSLSSMQNEDIQGMVAIGKYSSEQVKKLQQITDHIVFVDSSPNEEAFDAVVVDLKKATEKVLKHFIEKGHERIGYLGGYESLVYDTAQTEDLRDRAFKDYMDTAGMLDERYIYLSSFTVDEGYALMQKAIAEHGDELPTAFFVGNDPMAIGCLKALHENGIPVPARVNLISINDISVSKFVYPSLSTVKIHTELMGETAVGLLLEQIAGRKVPKKIYVGTELIIRESSF
jgi:LacI family transcriptional regulator